MPRRNLIEAEFNSIERNIQRRLGDSPLTSIGRCLSELVAGVRASVAAASMTDAKARGIIASVATMLDCLPDSFGTRFAFDSLLIKAIAAEWSGGEVELSNMIVPRHAAEWGHLTVPMPSLDGVKAHVVDAILFPGADDIEAIDLLDYPWIGHELGHNLHFRVDRFAACFRSKLDGRLNGLGALAIADRGTAKQKSMAAADMIRQVWAPSRDHRNWSHEIAIDIVALWTFGPAFVFAFDDFVERLDPDPFHVGKVHPPYHLRASALLDAASRLHWGKFTEALTERLAVWNTVRPTSYEYATLSDEDLLVAAVTCGLQVCNELGLPRLTPQRAEELREAVRSGVLPGFGSELVVSAWLAERELDHTAFNDWHNQVVRELTEGVTLEYQQ